MNKEYKIGDVVEVSYINKNGDIIREKTKIKKINQFGFYVLENGQTARGIK